ncbi:MAG: alpha-L-rhamnosidase C-terminal domain-containing protein [Propionibacteriaceae bacterium]
MARLSLNHRDGALPLTTRHVRFGWQLTAVDAVETSQVIVGRTPAEVRSGAATVWDSGRRTVDHPEFSDVCLHADVGYGPGELPLDQEIEVWWAVRITGPQGAVFDWSTPARLLLSATVGALPAPRPLATVAGSLATLIPQPRDDESLFHWLRGQGAGAVWPLVASTDLSARVGGWLDRLGADLGPGDPATSVLYRTLLDAADLCYDDARLRTEHGAIVTARQRGPASLQPAGVRVPDEGTGVAAGTAPHNAPYPSGLTMTDLLAPLLDSTDPSTALPVGIVVGEIAGIRSTAPGYRRFRVEPCLLSKATEVDVAVDTPRGSILVRLRRRPETLAGAQVTLGIPSGAVATLVLPWSGEELVLEAGSYVFVNT